MQGHAGGEDSLEESGRCSSVFGTSGGQNGEEAKLNRSDHVTHLRSVHFLL